MVALEDLKPAPLLPLPDHYTMLNRQRTFGYTQEDLKILLAPMALNGEEAIGSMGTDTALAVLSDKPRLLYDYFTQLFAQVTNPPLDAIREELVTSMGSTIGPEANLLKPGPEACRQIKVKSAIVNNEELARLRHIDERGFKSVTLPMLFDAESGGTGLARALEDLQRRTSEAVEEGYTIIILSDRGVNMKLAPIPSLLATAGVHHHLVREGTRNRAALVIETGEAREVHHLALLIGYGAGAVNPYLAFETLDDMIRSGMLPGLTHEKAVKNYIKALNKGVLKVMSKMGISTLQSYRGAQIFEAVGLEKDFVDRYFTHTASRIGGVGIDAIAEEVRARHDAGVPASARWPIAISTRAASTSGGATGSSTSSTPTPCTSCSTRRAPVSTAIYKEYTQAVNEQTRKRATLRGLFELKLAADADSDRGGRAGREHPQAVRDRRDVVRLDQPGSARDAGDCDEPPRRQIEHRRRRRRSGALHSRRERRFAAERDQAGRVGALRRDERVSGQRRRSADQDGAGREARRGRTACRATRCTRGLRRCATRRRASG